ncbi:MAG: TolC family protein [Marinisporobacter sp.]|jgi:outer membrane protein TolC|nr:TolC family protein [Marinisporobacter sp.]
MNKKVKKIACALSIATALSFNTAAALETVKLPTELEATLTEEINIIIGNDEYKQGNIVKTFNVAPYMQGEIPMLPLDFAVELAGMKKKNMEWDDQKKIMTIFKGNEIIQLTLGNAMISENGNKVDIGIAPEMKNETVMVPIAFINKVLGTKANWNSVSKTISIKVKKENKEEESISWDYTYQSLLDKALKNSKDLKKAEMAVDRADHVKEDAGDDIRYRTPAQDDLSGSNAFNKSYMGFKGAEIELQNAEKQVNVVKDKIAYDVKTAYYNVLKNEDAKKVAKLKMEVQNENMQHANIKYEYGTISELDKIQAKRDYEEAKKQYELAIKELDKAYEVLNNLVGLDLKDRYIVKDAVAFEKIKDNDVEGHIVRMIAESPDIWALQKSIELKDLGVKLYVANAGENYDAKEIDVKTAEITLSSTKEAYEKNIKSLYTSLKQLEDQYETNKIAYEKAKDDYKKAEMNLEVGNIAPIALKNANLQLENTKKQVREKIMDYNTAAMQYNKFWIASAGK